METSTEIGLAISFLDVSQAVFSLSGGFLCLHYQGTDRGRVAVRRVLPLREPERFLSIADAEQNEIAILRDLAELDEAQRGLVRHELDTRYYCPEILEVEAVKDKMGYVYLDIVTAGQKRSVAVKDVTRNIRLSDDKRLFVIDVDGNRYTVSNMKSLDAASLRRLEPYLF